MAAIIVLVSHTLPECSIPHGEVGPMSLPLEPGQNFVHLKEQDLPK